MKFNQKGYTEIVTVSIILGIIGALFITGVFVWQKIDSSENFKFIYINKEVEQEDGMEDIDSKNNNIEEEIIVRNKFGCYGYRDMLGFPPRFNIVDSELNFAESESIFPYQKVILDKFLKSEEFDSIKDKGELFEVCFDDAMAFTMYGTFDVDEKTKKSISIVGIYDTHKMVTNNINEPSLQGYCSIAGFIQDDIIIDCSMGDGGRGMISYYLLNKDEENLVNIKNCSIMYDDATGESIEECEIDIIK